MFVGDGYDEAKATLAAYGAQKVYRAESADLVDYLVVPQAELLAQLVETTSPAAVLIASSAEGKEVAARLAVKTGSGLITDAVDVQAGAGGGVETTQSVFAGVLHRDRDRHRGHADRHGEAELGRRPRRPSRSRPRRPWSSRPPTRPRRLGSPRRRRARRPAGPS